MGIKCQITKDRVGNIQKVVARNGVESKLYADALDLTKDQQEALDLWTVNYVEDFQENILPSIINQGNAKIQEELDKIQPKAPLNLTYSLERVSDSELVMSFKQNPVRQDAPEAKIREAKTELETLAGQLEKNKLINNTPEKILLKLVENKIIQKIC